MSVFARVQELRQQGANIVLLGVGELDINSPESAKEGAIAAIRENFTRYCNTSGIPELRSEVAKHLGKQTGQRFFESNVLISNGAKQATSNILVAILNKGDRVIIPVPYFTSHPIQVELAGGKPVLVKTEQKNDYQITKADLNKSLLPKTKAILITSPQNPTGSMYSKESLQVIADFVIKNDLWLISDEIYSDIVYAPSKFEPLLKFFPKLKSRLFILNGFSKSYAMTGWRVGYAAGPEDVIKLATNVQANTTSNVCSIAQRAALAAILQEPDYPKGFLKELTAKRDLAFETINTIKGIECNLPKGAFYLFPDVKKFLGKKFKSKVISTSRELTEYLLNEQGVAVVPGEAFGAPGNIRISFALDKKTLERGLLRIKKGLELLK